jgi:hypothetical protein
VRTESSSRQCMLSSQHTTDECYIQRKYTCVRPSAAEITHHRLCALDLYTDISLVLLLSHFYLATNDNFVCPSCPTCTLPPFVLFAHCCLLRAVSICISRMNPRCDKRDLIRLAVSLKSSSAGIPSYQHEARERFPPPDQVESWKAIRVKEGCKAGGRI